MQFNMIVNVEVLISCVANTCTIHVSSVRSVHSMDIVIHKLY